MELPPELICQTLETIDIVELSSRLSISKTVSDLIYDCVRYITSSRYLMVPYSTISRFAHLTQVGTPLPGGHVSSITVTLRSDAEVTAAANSTITAAVFMVVTLRHLSNFLQIRAGRGRDSLVGLCLAYRLGASIDFFLFDRGWNGEFTIHYNSPALLPVLENAGLVHGGEIWFSHFGATLYQPNVALTELLLLAPIPAKRAITKYGVITKQIVSCSWTLVQYILNEYIEKRDATIQDIEKDIEAQMKRGFYVEELSEEEIREANVDLDPYVPIFEELELPLSYQGVATSSADIIKWYTRMVDLPSSYVDIVMDRDFSATIRSDVQALNAVEPCPGS